jgi:hypothetical protein
MKASKNPVLMRFRGIAMPIHCMALVTNINVIKTPLR